jgi:hypothetical protein
MTRHSRPVDRSAKVMVMHVLQKELDYFQGSCCLVYNGVPGEVTLCT